jgi:mono/diheme cytochrome c family protein
MKARIALSCLLAGAAAGVLAMAASANNSKPGLAGAKVDNFMLIDQQGIGHQLYYYKTNPAVVIVSHQAGDKASAKAVAAIEKIRTAYEAKGVVFFALDSSGAKTKAPLGRLEKAKTIAVLDDDLQMVGRSLGVTSTAEVFVLNPKTWTVTYHGPEANLTAALDAMIAGQAPKITEAKVSGTKLNFPDAKQAAEWKKISYEKDVAPILANKCVSCHAPGGVAPFAMNSFEVVKGFAPMIREAVMSKRMPPFHSGKGTHDLKTDGRLTDAQTKTLVHWIEAGASRGQGEDPLAKLGYVAPEWPYGKPDVVLELPTFDVPASGIVDYQLLKVKNPTKETKFLQAVAYLPGARQQVHHIVAGWNPDGKSTSGQGWEVDTGGWGPGSEPTNYPADTGNMVPANGEFVFQMHYTPNGKAMTDKTRVGIYYKKDKPENILRQVGIADFSIEIPAGEGLHHERGYVEFPADVMLYRVRPHAHSRGYATRLTVRYPDGREEILHNQPIYDFNWQREYVFKDWLRIPAGSVMIADYIFDNSVNNKSNPDPKVNVLFGEQTFEEMLFTYLHYKIVGESLDNPRDDVQREITRSISFSVLDDDISKKIEPGELRGDRMKRLKDNFAALDKNGDGGLDKAEYFAAQAPRARAADAASTAAPAAGPT